MLNTASMLAVGAFFLGSIPFGLWVAWWVKGIDLRQVGSGNIGATNVTRTLGKGWGGLVLALDAAKGALPAGGFAAWSGLAGDDRLVGSVLGGLAAVLGHMFSPWLKFRGGKGVATATGVVLILAPIGCGVALAVFLLLLKVTRIVSIGSIGAAVAFAVTQACLLPRAGWTPGVWWLAGFSFGVPALIIIQHRANLLRLWRGEEHAFRKPAGGEDERSPTARG